MKRKREVEGRERHRPRSPARDEARPAAQHGLRPSSAGVTDTASGACACAAAAALGKCGAAGLLCVRGGGSARTFSWMPVQVGQRGVAGARKCLSRWSRRHRPAKARTRAGECGKAQGSVCGRARTQRGVWRHTWAALPASLALGDLN
eukprot:4475664-Prymnesium_polylepis.1